MPRGVRQAIQICREAFLLGAWRDRGGAHDQKLSLDVLGKCRFLRKRNSIHNTVVLELDGSVAKVRPLLEDIARMEQRRYVPPVVRALIHIGPSELEESMN